MDAFRKLVSKKKRRFVAKDGGFDLDLSYITPRIIAMGFPSENLEGVYRNPMGEVVRFLDTKHKDKYKVYNLCSERSYDSSKFHNRVACYPFDDHNAPPLDIIKPFCEDVDAFLKADPENVAVIHCKAGKGRTGVMICCYLVHSNEWRDPDEAMKFYGAARTENGKGVTIPSQQRYVRYYAQMVHNKLEYREKTVFLKKVILHTVPRVANNTCSPMFVLRKGDTKIYQSPAAEGVAKDSAFIEIVPKSIQPVCGDIKIEFFHKDKYKKPAKMFHFWFNTFMVANDEIILRKPEIDKANKDKKHAVYDEGFTVEVQFATLDSKGDEKPGRPRSSLLVTKDMAQALASIIPADDAKAGSSSAKPERRSVNLDDEAVQTDDEDLSDDESVLEGEGQANGAGDGSSKQAGSAQMA